MMVPSLSGSLGVKLEEILNRLSDLREKQAQVPPFPKLRRCTAEVSARFGEQSSPPAPPLQQRIAALEKLRSNRSNPAEVELRDWRLIAWGLADECGKQGRAIEDGELFPVIETKFNSLIGEGNLTRRMWFGLASSYFLHRPDSGTGVHQWERLRTLLSLGFKIFRLRNKSSQIWVNVFERHLDVFSESPGKQLGLALAEGRIQDVEEFRHVSLAPPGSWLWRPTIEFLLQQVRALDDLDFIARIEPTLSFAESFPHAADAILTALLQRYAQTRQHEQAHKALKDAALERWGSPQLGSARNRWSVNVAEPVCKMVMRWFAKEDLETFFKLLQGESGVDQDRLDYWLRFVGQIAYTRIVLGASANNDQSSDFVEFRKKNAQRICSLRGGTAEDNAFMMKIGGLLIVEFSKKGNACYFRSESDLPFKIEQKFFDLNAGLKNRSSAYQRLSHIPTNRGWWGRYDLMLENAGIYPDAGQRLGMPVSAVGKRMPDSVQDKTAPVKASFVQAVRGLSVDEAIFQGLRYANEYGTRVETMDNRRCGGAFWITPAGSNLLLKKRLESLGFKYAEERGYWIK